MNIEAALLSLAKRRPVFHSEADFQHALGHEIQYLNPNSNVRLEIPSIFQNKRASIDMTVQFEEKKYYLELKYKTKHATVNIGNEVFSLKNQGAKDHGSYDFLKDIVRVEAFVRELPNSEGFVIILTNDDAYWKGSEKLDAIDKDFHLLEGRELTGKMAWRNHAGVGSVKKREQPIVLVGSYPVRWKNYSKVLAQENGNFQYLCFQVRSNEWAKADGFPEPVSPHETLLVRPNIQHSPLPQMARTPESQNPMIVPPTDRVPEDQRHAVLISLKALGGQASSHEVANFAREHLGTHIKACSTVMADMVLPENGGNRTSTAPTERKLLRRVSRGVYRFA